MKKIVFVDGFYKTGFGSHYLLRFLLKDEFEVIPFKYKFDGSKKLESCAKELNLFINGLNLKSKEKIGLIGFSMGGLISSYYLKFINSKKVNKFVSIFSPFNGTMWASFIFKNRPAVKEMQLNSQFLKKLNAKKLVGVRYKNIYSPEDFIVPGELGKDPKADSIRVFFFMHPLALFWPRLIFRIRQFFKNRSTKPF